MTYGMHKATGGMRARWRQAWYGLPTMVCGLERCGEPAAGLIETLSGPRPVCAIHIPQAERLGYSVYVPGEESR